MICKKLRHDFICKITKTRCNMEPFSDNPCWKRLGFWKSLTNEGKPQEARDES